MGMRRALVLVVLSAILASVVAAYVFYPRRGVRLEEAVSAREPEGVPADLLPLKLPWVMEKGSERAGAHYASSLPRTPGRVLRVSVSANVGGRLAEALVEGDKIFLADHQGVYALDREGGGLVWGVEVYSDSLVGRAASHLQPVSRWRALGLWRFVEAYGLGRYLYVGTSSTPGGDAYVLAFDKGSGELVWRVRLESESGATSRSSVTSNLVVAEGRVFVGSVRDEGYVFCVTEDGALQWRSRVGGSVRGLAYGSGALYVTSEPSTRLYALDPGTGKVLWIFEHDDMLSTPVYANGRIVLSDSLGNLLAVSPDGVLLWKKQLGVSKDVNTNPYVAVDGRNVYAVRGLGGRPRELFKLDLNGSVLASFTMEGEEDGGRPLASNDVVVLPVLSRGYSRVYLLWRGVFKLGELEVEEGDVIWMPKVSAAYGEIYVVANPAVLYKLSDIGRPLLGNVAVSLEDRELTVRASACDRESGLLGVYLVYSFDGSAWSYQAMDISVYYFMEPIGGYGFGEEPVPYSARIRIPEGSAALELYVLAIDNVGNYEITEVYAYRIRG